MLVSEYAKKHHVNLDAAMDAVYGSGVLELIANPDYTYSTWAVTDLLDLMDKLEDKTK
jgi:hypothetical protein